MNTTLLARASEERAVSIRYFNLYRLVVASVFAIFGNIIHFGQGAPQIFEAAVVTYWLMAMLFAVLQVRGDRFAEKVLGFEVAVDIILLTLFMYASGGSRSGVPFLMMTFVAGAGLVGQGRMVLGAASFATCMVLAEQTWRYFDDQQDTVDFTREGLICIGFFFVALVANFLGRRALVNEALAMSRGRDLERQRHVNARIIQDMQDGVLVIAHDGVLRHANPKAEEWLGVSLQIGHGLAEQCPALFQTLHQHEQTFYAELTGKNLRLRYVEVIAESGASDHIVYLEDVDQLQAQAQQIKLAALGRLTANIAHEIRNPLSAVSHAGELMLEEKRQEVQARLLRIIHDNTARIERIVRDVMELGRRDRGTPEALDLLDFVRNAADEFSSSHGFPANWISLQADAGEHAHVLKIWFDRVHLYQIFANLVGNARRYCSGQAGAIRIELRALDERRVQMSVADDGVGIREEDRVKLFEPFFTSDPKGTGLGLYTARELAEANGATLNLVDSEIGAEFHLVARRVE